MKKLLTGILAVLLGISVAINLLLGLLLLRLEPEKPVQYIVEEFSVEDYRWGIENFPVSENVGTIRGWEDAAQKGTELWVKYLTIREENVQDDPINAEPIVVAYDAQTDCWLVRGTLPPEYTGAVPTAIIGADGKTWAVWMN